MGNRAKCRSGPNVYGLITVGVVAVVLKLHNVEDGSALTTNGSVVGYFIIPGLKTSVIVAASAMIEEILMRLDALCVCPMKSAIG